MANFQQRPVGPVRAEKLAAVAAAVVDARAATRHGEPPIDEGLRLIKAFSRITDPAMRRNLIGQAEDLARAVKGKTG